MTPGATATAASTRITGPVVAAVALGVATAYTFARSPFEPGAFPLCVFYAGTGLYCPGCGGLRAVHQLLHGQFADAVSLNALAVFAIIPLTLIALGWWAGSAAGLGWRAPRLHPAVWWGLGALVLAFSVARNFGPLAPYLAP